LHDSFDDLLKRKACSVDDEVGAFPWVVLTFENALPCRQLKIGTIGLSHLNPVPVHCCIRTNQLNLENLHTCVERYISPGVTRNLQRVDAVRDDSRPQP
jgi:hypothetical protein